jgi:hypothetical protein
MQLYSLQPYTLIEWIALIASVATVISVSVNFIQWRATATSKKQYYSMIFAQYNHMYRIGELADRARGIYRNVNLSGADRLEEIVRHIDQMTGIADAEREEIQAYCEKFLHRPVYRQRPAELNGTLLKTRGFVRKVWQRIW